MSTLFSEESLRFVLRTLLRLGAPQRDVEDLAQEVFLIVHRRASEFEPDRRVEPWLYGIARNIMREYWRKHQGRREVLGKEEDVAQTEHEEPHSLDPTSEQVRLLRQAISHLADPLLDVLMLRDLIGMTLSETARELGIPVDTAKDRLRRARLELRAGVEKLEAGVRCV